MKKNKLPSLVSILILTLLTSIVWISLSIYRALTAVPEQSVPQSISESLTPTLDQNSINAVESRIFFNSSQVPESVANAPTATGIPTPTPQPTLIPEATPSASPIATP